MIRVVIADDQNLVRESFALLLEIESDIEVVGQAQD
jgi:DNA-binding NarL/FixJ family response regulator